MIFMKNNKSKDLKSNKSRKVYIINFFEKGYLAF